MINHSAQVQIEQKINQSLDSIVLEIIKTMYLTESKILLAFKSKLELEFNLKEDDLFYFSIDNNLHTKVRNVLQDLKKKGVIQYNRNKIGWELL